MNGGPTTFSVSGLRIIKPASPDMYGYDVKSWQQLLLAAGFSPGVIDGYWGDGSVAACKAFQTRYGLEPDGVVGSFTAKMLIQGYPEV